MIDIQSVLPGLTPSRRDQGGCLAPWQTSRGGVPFGKKKLPFTKAHPGVTKDFAPRQTSRGGGPFGNLNTSSSVLTPLTKTPSMRILRSRRLQPW